MVNISLGLAIIVIIIVSVITFIIGFIFQKIKKIRGFRTFNKVFGIKNQDDFIISLPLWKVKAFPRDITRFQKVGFDGKAEEWHGPSIMVSYDDLGASAQIASILAEFFPKPVDYSLDTDRTLKVPGKSLILIGSPIANLRARKIFSTAKDLKMELPFEYVEQEETVEHSAALAIYDNTKDILYDCSGDLEYSMILRIPNYRSEEKMGGYFFIVSGPHAEGTLAASIYLKDNWEEFRKAQAIAGILLEMPRGDAKNFRVINKPGFFID
ncbi:MAG: hypothetical protein ACFFD2_20505 [Promethearchaeota archaeon]